MDWNPTAIRDLRGERSRASFADLVGVSPLTIYRWELGEDETESRRPRKKSRRRLDELAGSKAPGTAPDLAAMFANEGVPVDVMHLLADGRWHDVEARALEALASGRPLSQVGRVFLQTCVAKIQLLSRGDTRGALASLAPLLSEVSSMSGAAADWVHATAAVLFGMPDGRVFDAIRSAGHASRVRPQAPPPLRALALLGAALAAWHHGDASLFLRRADALEPVLALVDDGVIRAHGLEVDGLRAEIEGQPGRALQSYLAAADAGQKLELAPFAARMWGRAALVRLMNAERPERTLELVDRARMVLQKSSTLPGEPELVVGAAEAEALFRQGHFERADTLGAELETLALRIDWPPLDLALVQMRMMFHMGGSEAMDALAERFADQFAGRRCPAFEAVALFHGAVADMCRGDLDKTQQTMPAVARALHNCGTQPVLERCATFLWWGSHAYIGDLEGARGAQREAEAILQRLPSAWCGLFYHHVHGVQLSFEGRADAAREVLQAAADTLDRAGDVSEAARCRRARAIAAWIVGEPGADDLLAATATEMERLGIALAPVQQMETLKRERASRQSTGGVHSLAPTALVVPFRRLAVRGFSPQMLLGEIREAAATLLSDPAIGLEEVDGTRETQAHAEFSDGFGKRWRLVASGPPDPGKQTALELLATTAGLAIELATVRAGGPAPAPSDHAPDLPEFVATSEMTRALLADLRRVARSNASVLIEGESGVGKEVVARAVHTLSRRRRGPWITFNAAAVPRELFEGQLFGYRRGAFTGASRDHPGLIRAADGGTLFLDEIGDMPLEIQAKLLRFLENGEVLPLGETRPVSVDVRVVAATHRDLSAMVASGTFREDLYYRLQVVPVRVPPLRERPDDILPLARHFLAGLSEHPPPLAADAVIALRSHPWKGNVRELRNVVERTLALAPDLGVIGAAELRF